MSKATRRKWRRNQEREARERSHQEQVAKQQRLRGFRPASVGEMLTEVAKPRPSNKALRRTP